MKRASILALFALILAAHRMGIAAEAGPASVNTCVTCHLKLDDDKMAKPVTLWQTSEHQEAGISCQDCHGGNPNGATKELAHDPSAKYIGTPEPEAIHTVCGTCHQLQKENYVASPHGLEGSFWPSCVDCHSNHDVKRSVVSEIAVPKNCENCHDQEVLDAFITGIDRGLNPLRAARQEVSALQPTGVPIEEILAQVSLARDAFDHNASHTFKLVRINDTVDSLEKSYTSIEKQVAQAKNEVGVRRRYGWFLASLFILMAGVIWLYRRSLAD